jgi:hypothetical protein
MAACQTHQVVPETVPVHQESHLGDRSDSGMGHQGLRREDNRLAGIAHDVDSLEEAVADDVGLAARCLDEAGIAVPVKHNCVSLGTSTSLEDRVYEGE